MKRLLIITLLVGVIAVFGVVSIVSAQDGTPPVPGPGYGPGMMGRGGMMGGSAAQNGYGPMHEYMQKALAEKLGLTVEELQAKYAEGLTFWQIAEEQGLTVEQAQQAMIDARGEALDQMVADGAITQEQADWMRNRTGQGQIPGGCMGGRNGSGTVGPRGRMGGRGGSW